MEDIAAHARPARRGETLVGVMAIGLGEAVVACLPVPELLRLLFTSSDLQDWALLALRQTSRVGPAQLSLAQGADGPAGLLECLVEHARASLTEVDVSEHPEVAGSALSAVGRLCPGLTILQARGSTGIRESVLSDLLSGCAELATLGIAHCDVSDAALAALGAACPRLQSLDITGCSQITDVGLSHVASGCTALHTLKAAQCMRVTDAGITAVARRTPLLRELDLSNCTAVGDQSVKAVAECCPELQGLAVCMLHSLTDDGLAALIRGCPKLQHLDVWSCQGLSFHAKTAAGNERPELKMVG